MKVLQVRNIEKVYKTKINKNEVKALKNIDFIMDKGEYIAIMGESGSGKTTLLNILAALDRPTNGDIILNGKSLKSIKESEISSFRRNHLGFVFQDFNLLDNFSNRDNIFFPLVLDGKKYNEMEKRMQPIVKNLGIDKIVNKFPYEISGGQKQRVAIARALITKPKLLLADEPTGALDSKATDSLLDIFEKLNNEGESIVMVTHSIKAASRAKRILILKDGIIYHEMRRENKDPKQFFNEVSDQLNKVLAGDINE